MNFEYIRFYCLAIFKIDQFLFKEKTRTSSALLSVEIDDS